MKTSKISLVAVLALSLTLGLAASSWARPGGGMGGGRVRHDGGHEPHPRSGRQVL